MFLQYFGHVFRPLSSIEPLLSDLAERIASLAEGAFREGEQLRLRLGGARGVIAKTVSVTVGEPVVGAAAVRVPLSWQATGPSSLFPTMQADLVFGRLGEELTQVKLEGTYEPPWGHVGRMLDKAALHRVVEMSVKNFVDQVVRVLEETPGE